MQKKLNKKGFTIVELLIVIAVIAILAAVMIPTFAGMIKKANDSAALQEVSAAYKVYVADEMADGDEAEALIVVEYDDDTTIVIENGEAKVVDGASYNTSTYTEMEIKAIGDDKGLVKVVDDASDME